MPAKKKITTKKRAAKKAPAKKTQRKKSSTADVKAEVISPVALISGQSKFSVLDEDSIIMETRMALSKLRERKKNSPVGCRTWSEIRSSLIPLRHFYLQWVMSCYGLPQGSVMEVIAPEGVGKSSLAFYLMGNAMSRGTPCSYFETENKLLRDDWIRRILHPNPQIAKKMLSVLPMTQVFSQTHMEEELTDWVEIMRGVRPGVKKAVPIGTPLFAVIDTYTKLQSKSEEEGHYNYKGNKGPKSVRASSGDVQVAEHARFNQKLARRLPSFLREHDVTVLLCSHQNDKISTGPSFGGGDGGALYNKTRTGGRALHQNAAIQLVLAYKGTVKDTAGDSQRKIIRGRVAKNSLGPEGKNFEYDIIMTGFKDGENWQEPCISFDRAMCEMFAARGVLQTTVNKKLFSSPVLGLTGASPEEFSAAFHSSTDLVMEVGKMFNIYGYDDALDVALHEQFMSASKRESPPEAPAIEAPTEGEYAEDENDGIEVEYDDEDDEGASYG